MRTTPLPLGHEVAFLNEFLQSQLHGAGLAFGELHDLTEREGFVIGEKGDDLLGEGVEVGDEAEYLRGDGEIEGHVNVACLADFLADFGRFRLVEQNGRPHCVTQFRNCDKNLMEVRYYPHARFLALAAHCLFCRHRFRL